MSNVSKRFLDVNKDIKHLYLSKRFQNQNNWNNWNNRKITKVLQKPDEID